MLVAVLSCAAGPVSLAVLVTPSLGRHSRQWKQMQPWPKPCCSGLVATVPHTAEAGAGESLPQFPKLKWN